jgi:hypothetical protein
MEFKMPVASMEGNNRCSDEGTSQLGSAIVSIKVDSCHELEALFSKATDLLHRLSHTLFGQEPPLYSESPEIAPAGDSFSATTRKEIVSES